MDGYTEVELYVRNRPHVQGKRTLLVPVNTTDEMLINLAEEHLNDVIEWGFERKTPVRLVVQQVEGPVVDALAAEQADEPAESFSEYQARVMSDPGFRPLVPKEPDLSLGRWSSQTARAIRINALPCPSFIAPAVWEEWTAFEKKRFLQNNNMAVPR